MQTDMPAVPACVVLKHVAIVHFDTHQIAKQGMNRYYLGKDAPFNNTLPWIRQRWAEMFRAYERDSEQLQRRWPCWGLWDE